MKSRETIVLDDYVDSGTVEFESKEEFFATVDQLLIDKIAFIATFSDVEPNSMPQLYVFGHDSWVRYGTGS